MTTAKLILLRCYNISLGRFFIFAKLLKKILLKILIIDKADKYVASSKFFDWRDIK